MSTITDRINSATLADAQEWQASEEQFLFAIDFLQISARIRSADHWVNQLEMVFEGLIEQHELMVAHAKVVTKAARFDASRGVITVWLSPNMCGDRPCRSMAEARRIVAFTGVSQTIVREEA